MENNDPPFTFRALQVFVAAVEAQSVTRAAHRLGTSPSSVSQQLATLEAALGTKLIERSARQFRLTRSGTLFLDPARQILDGVGAAKAKLVMADETPPIHLRIASLEELDATVTAAWLLQLQSAYPQITFAHTSGASHENHDALSTRSVDIMLSVDTAATADWVEQHPILRDPFIVVTAPDFDVMRLSGGLAGDLTGVPFIRYTKDMLIGRQIEAQLRRSGMHPARGFEFSTNQALFSMTAELNGWAITTALAFLGTPLAGDLVTAHPLPIPQFSRRLALHARANALGGLPERFAQEMRDCLQEKILNKGEDRLAFLHNGFAVLDQV